MAINNLNFAAQVDAWTRETEDRLTRVFRQSTQEVSARMTAHLSGQLVNVQTGFLRASQQASRTQMPRINPAARPVEGQRYATPAGEISLVIAGAELGETIYLGFTASYAAYVEYGTANMAGRAFVGLAAQQWTAIVNGVAQRAQEAAGH